MVQMRQMIHQYEVGLYRKARRRCVWSFKVVVTEVKYGIFGVVETFLKSKDNMQQIKINGYKSFRRDRRKDNGGGICVCIRTRRHQG